MRKYAHAVLGGTFDRLHAGHAALLHVAFASGRRVSLGLTTDEFVRLLDKPRAAEIQSFGTRRRAVVAWVGRHYPRRAFRIVPLRDRFGRSVEPGVGVLVVSAETADAGRAVNAERRRRGSGRVPVVIVPLVLADDLRPVSSRRIRAGEIDRLGRRRTPLSVGISARDPSDRRAAARAVRRAFRIARIRFVPAPASGSLRATELSRRAAAGRELGIGIVRPRDGGWVVAERSGVVALDPRPIPGASPDVLERGLARILVPRRAQAL